MTGYTFPVDRLGHGKAQDLEVALKVSFYPSGLMKKKTEYFRASNQ